MKRIGRINPVESHDSSPCPGCAHDSPVVHVAEDDWNRIVQERTELLDALRGCVSTQDLQRCYCIEAFTCDCCTALAEAERLIDKVPPNPEVPASPPSSEPAPAAASPRTVAPGHPGGGTEYTKFVAAAVRVAGRCEMLDNEVRRLRQTNIELIVALQDTTSILETHMPPSDAKWDSNYLDKAYAAIARAERENIS